MCNEVADALINISSLYTNQFLTIKRYPVSHDEVIKSKIELSDVCYSWKICKFGR